MSNIKTQIRAILTGLWSHEMLLKEMRVQAGKDLCVPATVANSCEPGECCFHTSHRGFFHAFSMSHRVWTVGVIKEGQ